MIGAALITPDFVAAQAISQFLEDSRVFYPAFTASTGQAAHEIVRLCRIHDPYVILLDAKAVDRKSVV